MSFAPFDVVIVPFPYSEALTEKRRPAVVVSTREAAEATGQVWVVMITSTEREMFGDTPIGDLAQAGLPRACKLRAAKVATIAVNRVVRRAGALSTADIDALMRQLSLCAAF